MTPRGPDPDDDESNDQREHMERMARIFADAGAKAGASYISNHEGGKDKIWGVGATLLVAFVLGGLALSNQVSAERQELTDFKVQAQERNEQRSAEMTELKVQVSNLRVDIQRLIEQRNRQP